MRTLRRKPFDCWKILISHMVGKWPDNWEIMHCREATTLVQRKKDLLVCDNNPEKQNDRSTGWRKKNMADRISFWIGMQLAVEYCLSFWLTQTRV